MEKKKSSGLDKTVTVILLLICLVMAGATLYKMFGAKEEVVRATVETSDDVVINVSAAAASVSQFIETTRFQGEVTTNDNNISVLPETSGTLKSVQVNRGDAVSEGDVIAYVDPSRPGSQYEMSPVKAKVSGTVLSVDATAGSTVSASTPIITIMPDKTLYVSTLIPERYISTLSLGLEGSVTSIAYPDRSYPVEVSYMAPILNTTNRTLPVELSFTGDTDGILEGMYVSIDLVTEKIDDALIVPASAINTYAGESVVYVVKDGVAVRTPVVTGSSNSTEVVILSGLEAGDMVVTAGNVSDGTSVSIV